MIAPTQEKLVILLVEDDPALLEVNRVLFESLGHEVIVATSFVGAVTLLHKNLNRFVVALIDIHLSRLTGDDGAILNLKDNSGLGLLNHIRDFASHNVVPIVYTGDDTEETALKAYRVGVADFILKGTTADLLVARVENKFNLDRARASNLDKMTGLLNYNAFTENVLLDLQGARRSEAQAFSLIMIDADRFKDINETHSHLVGDRAIHVIGRSIAQGIRLTDLCCRRSGDEFFVWLRGATKKGALLDAVRIKRLVATSSVVGKEGLIIRPSISFGIAEIKLEEISNPKSDFTGLMERAEEELKRNKPKDGR